LKVIAKSTLVTYWERCPDCKDALQVWYYEAKHGEWNNPAQIKEKYRHASILKRGRVVFNICGNKYRLLCFVRYDVKIVYIKFVGTHDEYDKIDAEEYDGPPIKSNKKRK
jgi:mRNA interferase HigB